MGQVCGRHQSRLVGPSDLDAREKDVASRVGGGVMASFSAEDEAAHVPVASVRIPCRAGHAVGKGGGMIVDEDLHCRVVLWRGGTRIHLLLRKGEQGSGESKLNGMMKVRIPGRRDPQGGGCHLFVCVAGAGVGLGGCVAGGKEVQLQVMSEVVGGMGLVGVVFEK